MEPLIKHLNGIFELDASTMLLLKIICGSAVYAIREKVSSVFTLLLVFSVALLTSMATYYAFELSALFNVKNMAEWIVWTIGAGSIGNILALGVAIGLAAITDRSRPPLTSNARAEATGR